MSLIVSPSGAETLGAEDEEFTGVVEAPQDNFDGSVILEPGAAYWLTGLEGDELELSDTSDNRKRAALTQGAWAVATGKWVKCSGSDKNTKMVRGFQRAAGNGLPAGKANLKCGSEKWGYRHIAQRHTSQWSSLAFQVGAPSWQQFADFSMNQALRYPADVTYTSTNDTYTYRTEIQIRDNKGRVLYSFYSYVVVARVTKNVITAYPGKKFY